MAWEFCSKQDVMDIHPIDESALKDSWSDFVQGLIVQHKGNPYLGNPTTVSDEYHNGDGTDIVFVNKPPILSVTSLQLNGSSLLSSDYIVSSNHIQLRYGFFTKARANIVLTYESGVDLADIDDTVRFCAALMIVAIVNYRGRMGADSSIRFANAEVKEGEKTPNVNIGLLTHLKAIMRSTLRRDKIRVS